MQNHENHRKILGLSVLSLVVVVALTSSAFAMATGDLNQSSVSGDHYSPFGSTSGNYTVSIIESGLPDGHLWNVNLSYYIYSGTVYKLNNSVTSIVQFSLANGSYTFTPASTGYASNVTTKYFTVSGRNLTYDVSFTRAYNLTFTEKGLPLGTLWDASLTDLTFLNSVISFNTSSGNSAVISMQNGTYLASASTSGYNAYLNDSDKSYCYVQINGKPLTVNVTFVKTYDINFIESGLPAVNSWNVSIANATLEKKGIAYEYSVTNSTNYPLPEMNGTWFYSFSTPMHGFYAHPPSGSVTISGHSVSVGVNFTSSISNSHYIVNFTESGLPSGTAWTVMLNRTGTSNMSILNTITFSEPNGTYSYTIGTVSGYTVSPSSGSVTVNGSNISKMVTFTAVKVTGLKYNASFTETGLPSGISWSVTLNGITEPSTTNAITFSEPNGTYSYEVYSSSNYSASPSYGSVAVNGHNITMQIIFSSSLPPVWAFAGAYATYKATGYNSTGNVSLNLQLKILSVNYKYETVSILTRSYNSTVNHSQYENNTSWDNVGLWLDRQEISSLNNGSFTFGNATVNVTANVTVITPAGTFLTDEVNTPSGNSNKTVVYFDRYSGILVKLDMLNPFDASNMSLEIESTNVNTTVTHSYSVAFTETGLPAGTAWYMNLSNGMKSGAITGTSYAFHLTNGTYSYTVAAADKIYAPSPSSGSFTVNGASVSESVTFSEVYTVTFTESGLPSGTSWSVTINGITESSANGTITFTLPNGNYSYSTILPSGYSSVNERGNVSVSSASLSVTVNAKKITTPSSPVSYDLIIIAAVVAAALVAIAVAVMRRGKIKQ